ncbi:hypothetical protein CDEF62S_01801 [Castellaniella defragrans]
MGETAADYLAVDAGWGQSATRLVMAALLAAALITQVRMRRYTPWAYWLSVVLVSIVGTQITDLLTDGLGVSLYVSAPLFAILLALIFTAWYKVEHTLSIHDIVSRRRELFYWAAILCTFSLGTAAGDLATEALSMGFNNGVLIFGAFITITYIGFLLGGEPVLTFWIGYILTRPFGASLGDLLTQPKNDGGMGMGTLWTSALFLTVIVFLVAVETYVVSSQRLPRAAE